MSDQVDLETPGDLDAIFLATEDLDEREFRPRMTGDVLRRPDGSLVVLVQHPCAMRAGAEMLDRVLACEIVEPTAPFRSRWSQDPFYRMPLKKFLGGKQVDFRLPVVMVRTDAESLERVAIMDRPGINLLTQRWVHHNSRVVVKTVTYDSQSAGPYAEVELVEEGVSELVEAGMSPVDAAAAIDTHLGSPIGTGTHESWRESLGQAQQVSPARRALRKHTTALIDALPD